MVLLNPNLTYLYWFLIYGLMLASILLINWHTHPTREDWKKIIVISLLFEIPFQFLNILGISILNLWQNNADSPLPTLFGSPLETIPFAFLGAILSLLLFRSTDNWKLKGMLWIFLAFICALQAYLSTLFGFLTWVNWNFLYSFLFWCGLFGIIIGMESISNLNKSTEAHGAE
jgi:hypothetical protein